MMIQVRTEKPAPKKDDEQRKLRHELLRLILRRETERKAQLRANG